MIHNQFSNRYFRCLQLSCFFCSLNRRLTMQASQRQILPQEDFCYHEVRCQFMNYLQNFHFQRYITQISKVLCSPRHISKYLQGFHFPDRNNYKCHARIILHRESRQPSEFSQVAVANVYANIIWLFTFHFRNPVTHFSLFLLLSVQL